MAESDWQTKNLFVNYEPATVSNVLYVEISSKISMFSDLLA